VQLLVSRGAIADIQTFVGKIPSKEDFDEYVNKAKSVGQDSLKEIETQSKKVLDRVEKARKDGKSQADAFISGLKDGKSCSDT
jgi:hypothetical protein